MPPRPRAFRFGVGPGSIRAATAESWKDFARRVEDLGYAVLSVGDHVIMMGPIAAIATAAAVTTTLRVGSMTFGNDYRHPLVLAQEVATLDVLSGGRVEFALGAGWDTADYVQMGLAMDPPATRISRLGEAITIFNRFFTGEEFSFAGEHYTITGATGRPVPVQRPRPPLVIGGGGKRLLSLAGREADVVAINATLRSADMTTDRRNSATLADTQAKVSVVREAAGDRFDEIELAIYMHFCRVVGTPSERADAVAHVAREMGMAEADALASPHVAIGTAAEIAETLEARRAELGISYVSIDAASVEEMAPVVAQLNGS